MLKQTFHINRCLILLGTGLAVFCLGCVCQVGFQVFQRAGIKGGGVGLLTLLGQGDCQLDGVVPMFSQIMVRQVLAAFLDRLYPA